VTAALAGLVAALLLCAIAVFQIALALGAPLGAYAWGGEHPGVLPRRLRTGSAVSAPLLLAMAVIVATSAGLILPEWRRDLSWATWLIFLFMVINTGANWRSKSRQERRLMTPVTLVIAALLLVVQFSAAAPFSG
jgi:hypothetical protein